MTNLKQARQSGDFEKFIKEREGEEVDADAFNALLERIEKGEKSSPSESPSEDR